MQFRLIYIDSNMLNIHIWHASSQHTHTHTLIRFNGNQITCANKSCVFITITLNCIPFGYQVIIQFCAFNKVYSVVVWFKVCIFDCVAESLLLCSSFTNINIRLHSLSNDTYTTTTENVHCLYVFDYCARCTFQRNETGSNGRNFVSVSKIYSIIVL